MSKQNKEKKPSDKKEPSMTPKERKAAKAVKKNEKKTQD